jgi:hypothetical protein
MTIISENELAENAEYSSSKPKISTVPTHWTAPLVGYDSDL